MTYAPINRGIPTTKRKPLCSAAEVADTLQVSLNTLSTYRLKGNLIEGYHYIKINARLIKYYRECIHHWIDYGTTDPDGHNQFLYNYHNN